LVSPVNPSAVVVAFVAKSVVAVSAVEDAYGSVFAAVALEVMGAANVDAAEPVTLSAVVCAPPVKVVVAGEPKVAAPERELMASAVTVEVERYEEVAREKEPR
jgi:hypothetical protein